ncbi:exported hypothetical protein [Candidatus Sulfopaludibacter sp. SbA4]|nr:exported hypothetical protein [Candidatus Sulfopaludibacter sp. SbA4]
MRITRKGRKGKWRSGERKALLLIFLITAVPITLTLSLIAVSSRPDLYYITPKSDEPGVRAVSWQTLDKWAHDTPLTVEVELEGYMVAAEGSPAVDGRVARFLLVPDPGSWLHAPHLDGDEVIDVRLQAGQVTPLVSRKAVIVRGTLSFGSMESKAAADYHLSATSVRGL